MEKQPESGLSLWRLVNDLCKITQQHPEQFDPAIYLPQVQEIVNSLDGTLGYSSNHQITREKVEYVNQDGFQHKIDEEVVQEGVDEKRFGNYVVKKYAIGPRIDRLEFEESRFEDHRDISEQGHLNTNIMYNKQSKLMAIYTTLWEPWYFRFLSTTWMRGTVKYTPLWKKDNVSFPEKNPLLRRFLRSLKLSH